MIKNIVFDMGNVLILFYPEKMMSTILSDKDEIDAIVTHFYNTVEYREVDRGTMTYAQMLDVIKDNLPEHLVALLKELYVDNCFVANHMPPFPEMYELVARLKENGYKVYLLSNATSQFHEYKDKIPVMSLMDGILISADCKLLKPEREIYETLFEKFSLDPAECVFIDDVEENIQGGIACGMDGIVFSPSFESVSVLEDKLKQKGVKI
ncbi:MAG: HAD family phosphatase [Clostridia bacterium]|nr:HAD family phosphatase [Clostridia bacterium]